MTVNLAKLLNKHTIINKKERRGGGKVKGILPLYIEKVMTAPPQVHG
jgi:hypothetical protein